jgi:hypothetical protein
MTIDLIIETINFKYSKSNQMPVIIYYSKSIIYELNKIYYYPFLGNYSIFG